MKILYILNNAQRVNDFSYTSMIAAKSLGWEFHIAGNWNYQSLNDKILDEKKYGISIHQIDFIRSPYDLKNIHAYHQLIKLMKENSYDIVHCNTPIGGVCGRLASKALKVKRVIYEAHGFHFYKGAPLLNRIIYYPVEKWLSHYTDAIITINSEDYNAAEKFPIRHHGKAYYVHGVGIDLSKYAINSSDSLRAALGIKESDFLVFSAGDLVKRKNYKVALEAIKLSNLPNIKYCICGTGPLLSELRSYSESIGVDTKVLFLGYRNDVMDILKISDAFLFTSSQEGLARSMMEAMASGLPIIASRIRGNTDLLKDGEGGFLCDFKDPSAFADAIVLLASNCSVREKFSKENLEAIKNYDVSTVIQEMKKIYIKEASSI